MYMRREATSLQLSPRESEVAKLVSEGLSNKEIALILEISPWTVATYLKRIFDKLGVHRRSVLATLVTRDQPARRDPSRANDSIEATIGTNLEATQAVAG